MAYHSYGIKMASNKAAASWNQETKARLNDKISSNINDVGSILRQAIRGSKSPDVGLFFIYILKQKYLCIL